MNSQRSLSDQELRRIEDAASSGRLRDSDELEGWVRSLVAEVRRARPDAGAAAERGDPHKKHGDALLEGTGSRHGEDPAGR